MWRWKQWRESGNTTGHLHLGGVRHFHLRFDFINTQGEPESRSAVDVCRFRMAGTPPLRQKKTLLLGTTDTIPALEIGLNLLLAVKLITARPFFFSEG
jgi:hypothetical protein